MGDPATFPPANTYRGPVLMIWDEHVQMVSMHVECHKPKLTLRRCVIVIYTVSRPGVRFPSSRSRRESIHLQKSSIEPLCWCRTYTCT